MALQELEQKIADEGFHRDNLLEFLRLLPTNSGPEILATFDEYIGQFESAGVELDQDFIDRVRNDINRFGRVQPETIQGAPERPHIVLGQQS